MSLLDKTKVFKKSFMEPEEYAAFLSSILQLGGKMWYTLALTQGRHFMRISEAAAMKWVNFDPIKKNYFLCEHAVWPRNAIDPSCIMPGTKSRKAHEPFNVALFAEVVSAIQGLDRLDSSPLIFTEDGSLMTYRRIQHMYDKAFKHAGLPFTGTHILRHTGATLFQYYSGGNKIALQLQGGWKTARQSEHYAKLLPIQGRQAIDEIERKGEIK